MDRALLWASMLGMSMVGCVDRTDNRARDLSGDAAAGEAVDAEVEQAPQADEGMPAGGAGGGGSVNPGCDGREQLAAAPGHWDFGLNPTGSVSHHQISVRNDGPVTVEITHVSLVGSPDFDVTLDGLDPRDDPEVLLDPDGDGQPGISPGQTAQFSVSYTSTAGPAAGELTFQGDCFDPAMVTLVGEAPEAPFCGVYPEPSVMWTYPGRGVVLDPRIDGPAEEGLAYVWYAIAFPAGPVPEIRENFIDDARPELGGPFDNLSTPMAHMLVSDTGLYVLQLELISEQTGEAPQVDPRCVEGQMGGELEIHSRSPQGLAFALSWEVVSGPDSALVDGNLYVLHPDAPNWSSHPWMCSWERPNPDWGPLGPEGDCNLVSRDAVRPSEIEWIEIREPEPGDMGMGFYEVGADFGSVAQDVMATLKVYADGVLVHEAAKRITPEMPYWHAASVGWGGVAGWTVESRDQLYASWPE
ncbi:MAG: hypothetical protein ACE366_00430 [Bradymonadia bacterium]